MLVWAWGFRFSLGPTNFDLRTYSGFGMVSIADQDEWIDSDEEWQDVHLPHLAPTPMKFNWSSLLKNSSSESII